jgi:long-chain acyl-CoA synthetase
VPLYEAQTEADWRFIISNSDAKVVVVATREIYDKTLTYIGKNFPHLESIICLSEDPGGGESYRTLIAGVRSRDITPPAALKGDDLSAIVYTSGSTGNPKGVCLSHRSMITNVKGKLTK